MAETLLWLLVAFAVIFVINLVPAFMPSSWMVMAFFYIQFDLPLLVLTVGGAIVSGFGRYALARESTWVKDRFMRDKTQDLDELGAWLETRGRFIAPSVFGYSLLPLPTNNLFVAAGLAEVNMRWVLLGFWCARIPADTFFVWTTDRVFESLGDVFRGAFGSWLAIVLQLAGAVGIIVLYRLPWARWLLRFTRRKGAGAAPAG
jgi:hypothetical protein